MPDVSALPKSARLRDDDAESQSEAELSEADARMHGFSASKDGQRVDPKDLRPQWTMVVCSVCRTPWEVDGGPMCDHHDAETAEMTVVEVDADAEPIKTTSFHDQLRALRGAWERAGLIREHDDDEDAKLDADLQALAAEVRKHAPVLGTRGGLEERLWAALDRSVGLLERKLDLAVDPDVTGDAEAVRNIAETMDRLGLLEPPPVPVEAPEPDTSEVWVAASEAGLSTEQCDAIVARLCERYEGRA